MFRRPTALAAIALLPLAAAACASEAPEPEALAAGPAAADALRVVTAFYPLQYVTEQVGGEHVAVTSLAPPGVETHDLELTPQQVAEIAEADLVVYLTGFQPAVDDAVSAHAGNAIDVTEVVSLLDASGRHGNGHDDHHSNGHGDDHHSDDGHGDDGHGGNAHGDGHGDDRAGGDDGHDHGDTDPHIWLDPTRLATIADELATQLGTIDADNAGNYTVHAAELRQELETLDTEYAEGLAGCERREIVVSHAAFGYLADRYDLEEIAISGLSPEDESTPQRLAEVIHEAERHGATTIFFEVLVSDQVAQVIADEVGAGTAVLDPVEGLAPGSTEDYVSLMRNNLAALRDALGCR